MGYLALLWFSCIFGVGLCLWFVYDVVKHFGWPGLLLKVAVLIDGLFLAFVVASHQLPGAGIREHLRHIDDASAHAAFALWVVWSCFLFADWPMRWLMKRPVKWALYSGAVLVLISAFGAGKGWL